MTVTVNNKKPLVVPPSVRKQAGFKGGENEFKVSGRVITIHPKEATSVDEYTPAERRAIDRGIAQSEKEYAAGKAFGPFETTAEAIDAISSNLRSRAVRKKAKPTGR